MKYNPTHGINEKDRLSPFQNEGKRFYKGPEKNFADELLHFCRQSKQSSLPELKINQSERFTVGELGTSSVQVNFLKFMVQVKSCENILEIGTFIGSTTIAIAEQLPDTAQITTIEIGQEFAGIARQNFQASKEGKKIKFIEGDALKILGAMSSQTFDFVYMDGAKQLYPELYKLVLPLVAKGGLLVVDDILCNCDALNLEPTTDKGQGTKEVARLITNDPQWSVSILPVFNGMLLATKI